MGGGSMDYAYTRINAAIEEFDKSIINGGNHPLLRRRLAVHLAACSETLRAIEWADSCDTDAENWLPAAEAVLGDAPEPRTPRTPKATATARELAALGLADCAATIATTRPPTSWPLLSRDGYVGTLEASDNRIVIRFEAGDKFDPGQPAARPTEAGDWEVVVGDTCVARPTTREEAEALCAETAVRAHTDPAAYWHDSIYNRETGGRAVEIEIGAPPRR
ncbi:MAG: hypothetical protein F4X11_20750 [Acidobacteria bacterium]|nr:hypothetical protein [Chloroflexota bacterium]MYN67422.1 hypothetical protein [Acidobacteriota bacterium]